ncbi:MAG: 50S ribosomal protein L32, partial [Bacteroidota bacterium]
MPNPKHRHSRSRRDKRRANDHAALATLATCP